jgi:tRNA threonylcarbamoyladenosine biosynthesis protein TsaE
MAAALPPLHLPDPAATDALAAAVAPRLRAGDTLLLDGPVGAGKTAFARALIGALQRAAGLPPEAVPSPTFTLVQTYDAGPFEVWHTDLYRLRDPAELLELGLDEAFAEALCLVEWPDRLGAATPGEAVTLSLAVEGAGRTATLSGPAARLDRLAPALRIVAA